MLAISLDDFPVIQVAGLGKSYVTAAGLFPALKGVDMEQPLEEIIRQALKKMVR